jgi:ABC-type Na+ transport system ATPase subunit NatA
MQFKKFSIDHYRAVDRAEVPVGNRLIPLVGINESGKTSILQAILTFDRVSDGYGGSNHLDFKNKYVVGEHDCIITADVTIDSDKDLNSISKDLNLSRGNDLLKELENIYKSKGSISIHRNLKTKKYSVSGLGVTGQRNSKLAKAIYELLPLILYFDDFTDRVPEAVVFNRVEGDDGYKIRNLKLTEWRRILEEVFLRATGGNHSLSSFIAINDPDERDGLLNDINDVLDKEIMSDWRKLKRWSGSLADDPADIKLELRHNASSNNQSFEFQFKVTDRSRRRKRVFDVVDRSKGFQWLFNFLMKLKFNPKYLDVQTGAIYLLDEPGSYLHSSAQEELLKELEEISKTNTILYCTHSQHLLDPNIINIGQTRIVSKEQGAIRVIPFGSAETDNYQGALTPLFHALQLRTGIFNRNIKKAVITEGITDYYFFEMLRKYLKKWNFGEINFIPGAGAGQLKELISWSISWTESYLVILDSDDQGVSEKQRYERFFGARQAERFILLSTPSVPNGVKLEDFLSENDKQRFLDETNAKHAKNAITEAFFMPKERQKRLISKLDSTTLDNLSILKKHFHQLNDE